ncbi:MAG: hypothetical protein GYB50_04080 [Rhodobacteraceae bacterium]|nr:hypothetical protein [Paracoccaceae bacterium]
MRGCGDWPAARSFFDRIALEQLIEWSARSSADYLPTIRRVISLTAGMQ